MSAVKRYVVLAAFGCFALLVAVALLVFARPDSSDDRLAAREHSHQGITLMQQHLYHAAIDEFQAAI